MKSVVGLIQHFPVEAWTYPEISEYAMKMMEQTIEHKIAEADKTQISPVLFLEPLFYRYTKEQHHEHGWQWIQEECDADEAEYILLRAEAECE